MKNLSVSRKPTAEKMGVGIFSFTDDYSVFDFGKMPDTIPDKGEALCRMAAYNFEELEKRGIKTHFRKLVSGKEMEVDLVRVLDPAKGELKKGDSNYLVPLEVMFRNFLPEGSSLLKRFADGTAKPSDYGLRAVPKPNEKLAKPILDVSTKLEVTDRYLSWKEAQEISFLSDTEMEKLKSIAFSVNAYLNEKAASIGLEHADGKIELALTPERELVVVDVLGTLDENRFLFNFPIVIAVPLLHELGTLDENRFLFNGVHLSKQVVRDYYLKTPWYSALKIAKDAGKPKSAWPKPEHIPAELKGIVSNMYKSTCEAWIGRKIWGSPKLESVMASYKSFCDKK